MAPRLGATRPTTLAARGGWGLVGDGGNTAWRARGDGGGWGLLAAGGLLPPGMLLTLLGGGFLEIATIPAPAICGGDLDLVVGAGVTTATLRPGGSLEPRAACGGL
jgi:hypothetical protein